MNTEVNNDVLSKMNQDFLEEYRSDASIRRYTKRMAGHGINYLLEEIYGAIYMEALQKYLPRIRLQAGVRVLEFGCGGGMNILHLVSLMHRNGIGLDCAYGTDFSDTLVAAANREAAEQLPVNQRSRVRFCVARNEALGNDMCAGLGIPEEALRGTFDIVIGVNTIRYCHRLGNDLDCVKEIHNLLTPQGVCIVIDMNKGFPLFRSRLRDRLTKEKQAYFLPSLEEYVRPFSTAGFEVLESKHFCWVPHSAGPWLTSALRILTPALNTLAPKHAMRSLVISRKRA